MEDTYIMVALIVVLIVTNILVALYRAENRKQSHD
jgi:hypothetical protein